MDAIEIWELRQSLGMSQREFAVYLGLSESAKHKVRAWECDYEEPTGPLTRLMETLNEIEEMKYALAELGGQEGRQWLYDHGYMVMPEPGEFEWPSRKEGG